jgi:hypothetical protein
MNIRKLINLLEDIALDESTGGIARRWIEIQGGKEIPFVDANTKEPYTLIDVQILPADPEYKYEDTPQQKGTAALDTAIQNIVEETSPLQVNVYGLKNGRAAMVCVMQNSKGDVFVFAKKVLAKRSLGPNGIFWQTTDFAKETGLWAQTAQMKKAAIPIEPTDFVEEGRKYSIRQLVQNISQGLSASNLPKELKDGLPELIKNVQLGNTTGVPGLAEFQSAIEIKLSELAAPIALQSGNFVVGDYDTVNNELLKPMGFTWQQATAVSFPAKAEKLIDATIWFGDEKIDISVKDSSGGGRPSTATIAETLATTEFGGNFETKYKNEIAAIETLDENSAIEGPLLLAQEFGVLDNSDIDFLMNIYAKGVKNVEALPKRWQMLMEMIPYQPDDSHPEYQLGYHLLAVCAKYVAGMLNQDSAKVTDFFKQVLNKSSLVQVYAKTKADKQGGLYYNQFKVVWPPVFNGSIEVDADSYTARTKPSRKISFSFNAGKPKDQYNQPAKPIPGIDSASPTHSVQGLTARKGKKVVDKDVSEPRQRR